MIELNLNPTIKILALTLHLGIAVQSQAQHFVRLSKIDNQAKVKQIRVGTRVGCVLNPDAKREYNSLSHVGILRKISPDSISISKANIAIKDIGRIGKRMGGTTILSALLTFGGVGLIKSGTTDNTPCTNCQTINSDTGGDTASIIGGVGMIGLGIVIIANNAPKSLNKWKLEVVEQSTVDKEK